MTRRLKTTEPTDNDKKLGIYEEVWNGVEHTRKQIKDKVISICRTKSRSHVNGVKTNKEEQGLMPESQGRLQYVVNIK